MASSSTAGQQREINNLITGVGGFTFYAREAGGGSGQTITLNNTSGTGGGTSANYQGPTSFFFSYQDGLTGSGGNGVGNIVFGAANQIPAGSRVILNTVEDLPGYPVTPNINSVGVDMGGFSQSFGSIEGNVNLKNFSAGTLTIGANNLSTTYTGIIGAGGGAGKLVKVGSGTQTLSGANAYTGTTSIIGGTLLIGIRHHHEFGQSGQYGRHRRRRNPRGNTGRQWHDQRYGDRHFDRHPGARHVADHLEYAHHPQ